MRIKEVVRRFNHWRLTLPDETMDKIEVTVWVSLVVYWVVPGALMLRHSFYSVNENFWQGLGILWIGGIASGLPALVLAGIGRAIICYLDSVVDDEWDTDWNASMRELNKEFPTE